MAVYIPDGWGFEKIGETHTIDIANIKLVKERQLQYGGEMINSPAQIADFAWRFLDDMDREVVLVFNLTMKCDVINFNVASVGTINAAIIAPREIFKGALLSNAGQIAIVHNHPSGDITPSEEDMIITDRIIKAGQLMGIPLVDHIIVGSCYKNYYSFYEQDPESFKKERLTYPIDISDLMIKQEKKSRKSNTRQT